MTQETAQLSPFPNKWNFLCSVPSLKFLPAAGPLEIAFCGRSNVGKSSLINALTNQKGLARTSNTPGRTQELNYFVPEPLQSLAFPFVLVDMPGYGYAEAPKKIVDNWTNLILDYLKGRTSLRRVYILIDSRHGLKKNDLLILDILDNTATSYQIILTKIDKIKEVQKQQLYESTELALKKRPAAFPAILAVSSLKNQGIKELQQMILQAISY